MKSRRSAFAVFLSVLTAAPSVVFAKGAGTSGGLTLIEAPTARAASLAEAYTATVDDVAAFSYNPSSLKTLKTGQASFLYQKGLLDDAYSQFMIGSPWHRMGVGMQIGYYNGGNFDLSDGVTQRSVTAEKDLMLALGAARAYGPLSIGLTGKYLSSTLVETKTATAYAADIGINYAYSPRLQLGGALQNFGTQLKFVDQGDNLPRIFRLGASYALLPQYGTTLLFDVQRMINEGETRPAIGIETRVGPMALRAGYRHGSTSEFSVGTGFAWGRSSLDYSFGLMSNQDLQSNQRISYSFRFGGPGGGNQLFVRKGSTMETASSKPNKGNTQVASAASAKTASSVKDTGFRPYSASTIRQPVASSSGKMASKRRVYTIKAGDSLASIARDQYGDHRMWQAIYMANRHIISSPTDISVGQKIALP